MDKNIIHVKSIKAILGCKMILESVDYVSTGTEINPKLYKENLSPEQFYLRQRFDELWSWKSEHNGIENIEKNKYQEVKTIVKKDVFSDEEKYFFIKDINTEIQLKKPDETLKAEKRLNITFYEKELIFLITKWEHVKKRFPLVKQNVHDFVKRWIKNYKEVDEC